MIWNPSLKIQYEQYESYHHYVLAKLWNKNFHHLIILLEFLGKKHDAVIFRKQLPDVCDSKLLFCTKKQTPIGALRFFFGLHQSKIKVFISQEETWWSENLKTCSATAIRRRTTQLLCTASKGFYKFSVDDAHVVREFCPLVFHSLFCHFNPFHRPLCLPFPSLKACH